MPILINDARGAYQNYNVAKHKLIKLEKAIAEIQELEEELRSECS